MTHRQRYPIRARGFTLLEAIVTLVVVSLIVTVLMQSLAHSLNIRTRVLRHQTSARVSQLQENWFRESLSSAMADLPDGIGKFEGTPERVQLVSLNALGDSGPNKLHWRLQPANDGTTLLYSDSTLKDVVMIDAALSEASFSYCDHAGQWHGQWPVSDPAGADPARAAPLPRAIRLQAQTHSGELLWLVAIVAEPVPASNLRPTEFIDGL